MPDADEEAELSESAKEELRRILKETFGGILRLYLAAVVGVCMGIVVLRTGVIPFVPDRLSTPRLVAIAAIAALGWFVLYLSFTRPAKQRLQEKFEELEDET